MTTHHFHNINFSINTQVVQECLEILLHLYAVVLKLSNGEDAHLAVLPDLRISNISYHISKSGIKNCAHIFILPIFYFHKISLTYMIYSIPVNVSVPFFPPKKLKLDF